MSADERERLHLVRQHLKSGLGRREASERMGIGVRQLNGWFVPGDNAPTRASCPAIAAGRVWRDLALG